MSFDIPIQSPVKIHFDHRMTVRQLWEIIIRGRHNYCDVFYGGKSNPRFLHFKCYSCRTYPCGYWTYYTQKELNRIFKTTKIKRDK